MPPRGRGTATSSTRGRVKAELKTDAVAGDAGTERDVAADSPGPRQHIVRLMKKKDGDKGNVVARKLQRELTYIKDQLPTFDAFMEAQNLARARFKNLVLFDHSRVNIAGVIVDDEFVGKENDNGTIMTDFIHASYVDGYEIRQEYILCQAPFDDTTEVDFWRMVMVEQPMVILVLGNYADNRNDIKNDFVRFWPVKFEEEGKGPVKPKSSGVVKDILKEYLNKAITIKTEKQVLSDHWDQYELSVTKNGKKKETFDVKLLHLHAWKTDADVPDNFIPFVTKARITAELAAKERDTSILTVCSSGAHKCGVYASTDICIKRMTRTRRVAMYETINEMRQLRYGLMQNLEHYFYLAEVLIAYAIQSNYVNSEDLGEEVLMFKLRNRGPDA